MVNVNNYTSKYGYIEYYLDKERKIERSPFIFEKLVLLYLDEKMRNEKYKRTKMYLNDIIEYKTDIFVSFNTVSGEVSMFDNRLLNLLPSNYFYFGSSDLESENKIRGLLAYFSTKDSSKVFNDKFLEIAQENNLNLKGYYKDKRNDCFLGLHCDSYLIKSDDFFS